MESYWDDYEYMHGEPGNKKFTILKEWFENLRRVNPYAAAHDQHGLPIGGEQRVVSWEEVKELYIRML